MPSAHTLTDTFYHTLTRPVKKQHTCAHVSIFACIMYSVHPGGKNFSCDQN